MFCPSKSSSKLLLEYRTTLKEITKPFASFLITDVFPISVTNMAAMTRVGA
jgi:hypothetical protein